MGRNGISLTSTSSGSFTAEVPGFFLYYPSRAQRSEALRLFVEAARELSRRSLA